MKTKKDEKFKRSKKLTKQTFNKKERVYIKEKMLN